MHLTLTSEETVRWSVLKYHRRHGNWQNSSQSALSFQSFRCRTSVIRSNSRRSTNGEVMRLVSVYFAPGHAYASRVTVHPFGSRKILARL